MSTDVGTVQDAVNGGDLMVYIGVGGIALLGQHPKTWLTPTEARKLIELLETAIYMSGGNEPKIS